MRQCAVVFLAMTMFAFGDDLPQRADRSMRKAAGYFYETVALRGGYVWHYSEDLKQRWGEGVASPTQIWVQPPGTPSVGMVFLEAYEATGDKFYLDAAVAAARALMYGQLRSGCWSHSIDFNPKGKRVGLYRNGKGKGRNYSTFDDNSSQSALRLMMRVDQALDFKDKKIHEAAQYALNAMLKAQFKNGAFPQGWRQAVPDKPVLRASFPDYDWRTEKKAKNYWDLYTLNDRLVGDAVVMLIDAHRIYKDERYLESLKRLGDFVLLAQLPEPQPAWSQQYTYEMCPAWARRFEPPAITSTESVDAMEALLRIYLYAKDERYLKPVPPALSYLKSCQLPDGMWARFYELRTNKPLYMSRKGKVYSLTYDASKAPSHYAWKVKLRLDKFETRYKAVKAGKNPFEKKESLKRLASRARAALTTLDEQGRSVEVADKKIAKRLKVKEGTKYISSRTFCRNLEYLAKYLKALKEQ